MHFMMRLRLCERRMIYACIFMMCGMWICLLPCGESSVNEYELTGNALIVPSIVKASPFFQY